MNEDMFLGKPISYWVELDSRAKELNYEKLILDIIKLSAKVNFYESKLLEVNNFKNEVNEL